MYKVASANRQSALHRGRLSDWANGVEYQTLEQRLRQAKEGARIIEQRINAARSEAERIELGAQKFVIQNEVTALKRAMHPIQLAREPLGEAFMSMARQMLPKVQFEMIKNATTRELQQRRQRLEMMDAPAVLTGS